MHNNHSINTGPITIVTIPQELSILPLQHTVLLTAGFSVLLKAVLVKASRVRGASHKKATHILLKSLPWLLISHRIWVRDFVSVVLRPEPWLCTF